MASSPLQALLSAPVQSRVAGGLLGSAGCLLLAVVAPMAAQRPIFEGHGPRDSGSGSGSGSVHDAMEEDDDDNGVFSMDAAADVLEEEFSEQLNAHELFNALPPDVFAAAHTGDCQAVRAFLSDPRGDVNMRDRHAAVLARTVLPTSWANPPVHPNANPPGQAP